MCDGTNHNLKVIYGSGNDMEMDVVRWCADCGAVVVDIDADGRTMMPGGIRKMQFPSGIKQRRA